MDRLRSLRPEETTSTRPSMWNRFQDRVSGWFGRNNEEGNIEVPASVPQGVPVSEPAPVIHQKMPSKVSFAEPPLSNVLPETIQTPTSETSQVTFRPAAGNPGIILPKFADKVGHEEDYSWVTGQLVQANGQWVIHYATPDTVDRFGGNLVLVGNVDLNSYQAGDLVNILGSVVSQNGRQNAYLMQSIHLVEHK